jgi:hypothetical protein
MSDTTDIELHVPMSVRTVNGLSKTELDKLVRDKAFDPTIFDEPGNEPFYFDADISNRNLDFYLTRMSEDTLRNFADDASTGVSFQNSHDVYKLGFGRSLHGRFIEGDQYDKYGVRIDRTLATFYTTPGMKLHDVSTDDFIKGVRNGTLHDVSVGFTADEYRCSICGGAVYDSWFGMYSYCEHVPGLTYTLTTEDGSPVLDANGNAETRTAWVDIIGGHLHEVSAVYKGACPEAAILKADYMAKSGRMTDIDRARFEAKYRTVLPERIETFLAATAPLTRGTGGNTEMVRKTRSQRAAEKEALDAGLEIAPDDESQAEQRTGDQDNGERAATPDAVDPVEDTTIDADDDEAESDLDDDTVVDGEDDSAAEPESGDRGGDGDAAQRGVADPFAAIRDEMKARKITLGTDPVKAVRALADALEASKSDARIGRQYRKDMIEEALKAGVRSMAPGKFKTDVNRRQLEKAESIQDIKDMRDMWLEQGDERLQGNTDAVGGRLTLLPSLDDGGANETTQRKRPASAHRG